jgi:tRNA dimethylallyltransferase
MTIVIGGPTASGKSALALAVADRVGGEIVCADSRQVYAGLPIASAGPTAAERARVPHHLYESVDPASTTFTAAAFVAACDAVVGDIRARGKVPVIVGGTGLYLRAWRLGLDESLPTDVAVRAQLEADLKAHGLSPLIVRLREADPTALARIDTQNPVRVVRALEIALLGGDAGGRDIDALLQRAPRPIVGDARFIVVDHPALQPRIEARVRAMFAGGVVDEAAALAARLPEGHALLETLGVAEALQVSLGSETVEAAIATTSLRTWQYARRQRRWFKKEPWWTAVDASADGAVDVVA